VIFVSGVDNLATVSIFIALLSLVVTIRSLKLTEQASKAADNSLMLSMYLQKRSDLANCLTYYYYPLNKFLYVMSFSDSVHPDKIYNYEFWRYTYLGEPDIVNKVTDLFNSNIPNESGWIEFDKVLFESVSSCVHSVIDQKNKEIAVLTKKIEGLGGEFLL